jgi:hypothetical protein
MMKKNNRLCFFIITATLLFLWGLVALDAITAFAKPTLGENCQGCHNKTKQELLNSTNAVKPTAKPVPIKVKSPHPSKFFKAHGSEVVIKGVTSCNKCHQSTNYCTSCHRKSVQPSSIEQTHNKVKKYNDNLACSKCHEWAKAKN